jgi:hypothetical protein
MSQQFRLSFGDIREAGFALVGDALMQFAPPRFQDRVESGVTD